MNYKQGSSVIHLNISLRREKGNHAIIKQYLKQNTHCKTNILFFA